MSYGMFVRSLVQGLNRAAYGRGRPRGGLSPTATQDRICPDFEGLEPRLLLSGWTFSTIHSFTGTGSNDSNPGDLSIDSLGSLYDTTFKDGAGTIFKVAAGANTTTTLATFNEDVANLPLAGLIADASGNLYGTTEGGGANGWGSIFKLAHGSSALTTLYSFTASGVDSKNADGCDPIAGLVLDGQGNLYGTTFRGGSSGFGTVFKLSADGAFTVLHSFTGTATDGCYPTAGLVLDGQGNLFGTTEWTVWNNGTDTVGFGTVFEISSAGTYTLLHSFTGTGDGVGPEAALVLDAKTGDLYGTTSGGGDHNGGTIFKIAHGSHTFSTLYAFNGTGNQGAVLYNSLVLDGQGNLYGTGCEGGTYDGGTVFELSAGGAFTTLHTFTSETGGVGVIPDQLVCDGQGNLYGTTYDNGTSGNGTIFKLTVDYSYDLTGEFGTTWTLPPSVLSDSLLKGSASVTVRNIGGSPLPSGQLVNIQLVARDTTNTTASDITLATLSDQSISALAVGGAKQFTLTVNRSTGLPSDDYQVFADIVPKNHRAEFAGEDNWVSQTAAGFMRSITSASPFTALNGVFGTTWTLPSAVLESTPVRGTVSVAVRNLGNIAFPAGQKVSIELEAVGRTSFTLGTLNNQSVSALAAGGSKQFSIPVNLPAGLPRDTYDIVGSVSPVQELADDMGDDIIAHTAAGVTKSIISAQPFVDLAVQFGNTMRLPATAISGDGKLITVPVVVRNLGNVAMDCGRKIDIEIDAGEGTLLKTLTGQSVGSLGAGKSKTFTATVTLPPGLTSGQYNLMATVDPTNQVTDDADPTNNTETSPDSIDVTEGDVDLAGVLGTAGTLPSAVVNDMPMRGTASVMVRNIGNVRLPAGQKVTIELEAQGSTTIPLARMTGQSVGGLAAGGSKQFTMTVNLPTGLPEDAYTIVANIIPTPDLTELDTLNNQVWQTACGLPKAINSGAPIVDLSNSTLGASTLPKSITADTRLRGMVPVAIKNTGSTRVPSGQSGMIELVAHNTETDEDFTLETDAGETTGGLAIGATRVFYESVDLCDGLPSGSYQIEAVITPGPEANFTAELYTVLTNSLGQVLNIVVN